jgi:hypothetical protein
MTGAAHLSEQPGASIGGCELLEQIGEGGMRAIRMADGPARRPESSERIVQLHEATGNAAQAAKWSLELEAHRAGASTPPAERDER